MTVLSWDTPKKARSSAEHANEYVFDGGPSGGYVPNMSDDDSKKWKAKVAGKKRGVLQVEIRKSFYAAQLVIIVCLDGNYTYKNYGPGQYSSTDGVNVHVATNGPIQMTFQDMADLHAAVAEARDKLQELQTQ